MDYDISRWWNIRSWGLCHSSFIEMCCQCLPQGNTAATIIVLQDSRPTSPSGWLWLWRARAKTSCSCMYLLLCDARQNWGSYEEQRANCRLGIESVLPATLIWSYKKIVCIILTSIKKTYHFPFLLLVYTRIIIGWGDLQIFSRVLIRWRRGIFSFQLWITFYIRRCNFFLNLFTDIADKHDEMESWKNQ